MVKNCLPVDPLAVHHIVDRYLGWSFGSPGAPSVVMRKSPGVGPLQPGYGRAPSVPPSNI